MNKAGGRTYGRVRNAGAFDRINSKEDSHGNESREQPHCRVLFWDNQEFMKEIGLGK
jgi:hypothetical protein